MRNRRGQPEVCDGVRIDLRAGRDTTPSASAMMLIAGSTGRYRPSTPMCAHAVERRKFGDVIEHGAFPDATAGMDTCGVRRHQR
jgi:hypothetical protein